MRRLWLLLALGVVAALLIAACGDGDLTDKDVIANAANAVRKSGMVFHAKGDDGSEVWIDSEGQHYRKVDAGTRLFSVGEGHNETSYDPSTNKTSTQQTQVAAGVTARIVDPEAFWFEPLNALSFAQGVRLVGKAVADGKDVIAIETDSPVVDSQNQPTGSFLVGRVEMDPDAFLVTAFETRTTVGEETVTPSPDPSVIDPNRPKRIRYTTEFLQKDSLPADFFDPKSVDAQIVTVAENIRRIRAMTLTPYWFGQQYANALGNLVLPDEATAIVLDASKNEASFHYSLQITPSAANPDGLAGEAEVIRLGIGGSTVFDPPTIQGFAGSVSEDQEVVDVQGNHTVIYTAILTPADLPCPAPATCPQTDAPLYHRLLLTLGDTAIQIETFAKVGNQGQDVNQYNTHDGIIALANALTIAQ